MRVKYTYTDLYHILKALLSGRDEQFVGILVKGYHVTPLIQFICVACTDILWW